MLLVENLRRDGARDWSPPGGVIDENETVVSGLTREVEEATGVRVWRWNGPVYEVEVEAPGVGWGLRVEVHLAVDFTGDLPRAISRRLLSAGYGLREAATSLAEAFARAEDLVYVETSAIDALSIGAGGDTLSPVQTLRVRLEHHRARERDTLAVVAARGGTISRESAVRARTRLTATTSHTAASTASAQPSPPASPSAPPPAPPRTWQKCQTFVPSPIVAPSST